MQRPGAPDVWMEAGEVEWLAPIEWQAAQLLWRFERLRCEPIPHVLHFA